jgi:hypothetical protein
MMTRFGSSPGEFQWDLSSIADASRLRALKGAGSAEDLLAAVVAKMNYAVRSGDLRVGWEQAQKNAEDHRIILRVRIGAELFDWFFNARTGYRAQCRVSAEAGTAFNARLVRLIREVVTVSCPDTIAAREMDPSFRDQGAVLIEKRQVEASLVPELSRAWFCGRLIQASGSVVDLIVSVSGPRIVVGPDDCWATIDADEEMAWLDVKGAFLGVDGAYQVKSPEERGSRLNKLGTA